MDKVIREVTSLGKWQSLDPVTAISKKWRPNDRSLFVQGRTMYFASNQFFQCISFRKAIRKYSSAVLKFLLQIKLQNLFAKSYLDAAACIDQ